MFQNISIKINLRDSKNQIKMYDVPAASSIPYQSGVWIGATQHGGSCNFNTISITPHCNGTHTECIGHIVNEHITLSNVLINPFFKSLLISISFYIHNHNIQEKYFPSLEKDDKLLLKYNLEKSISPYLPQITQHDVEGIIIRTLPNNPDKKHRDYNIEPAPFFSNDAIQYLCQLGFKHLIVDVPSLDKAYDEGFLSNHHIFWNQPLKNYTLEPSAYPNKTITELVFIHDNIPDGIYETFIGFPNWQEDAVPSSVWIKPLEIRYS